MQSAVTPPASRMQEIVAEIDGKGDFPAAAQVIERLRTTVGRENCAALDVARVILKDPATAFKVLRLVNSAFYRKGGEPISTVTRAVIVMGFEAIRDLTTGLVLVGELLRQGRSNAFVRSSLRRGLLCGLVAQRLAALVGHANVEEAYLLGLFSDWGLLWLAAYYRPEFEQAQALAHQRDVPLATAACQVFGDEPAVLAAAILERWSFPPAFASHFRAPPPRAASEMTGPGARLSAIVSLASDYASAVDAGPEAAARVLERGEQLFGVKPEQLLSAVRAATEAVGEHAALLGLGSPAAAPPRAAASPSATHSAATGAHTSPTGFAAGGQPGDAQTALAMVAEIARSIVEQRDLNEVLLMVLEGVARSGGFDAAFLALLNRQHDRIVGRLGYGDGVEEYLTDLSVPVVAGAGALADTILGRAPMIVPQGSPALLVPPGTPMPRIPAASFVTSPLLVRQKVVGVLVALRGGPPPVAPSELATVELFCNQAAIVLHHYAR